jgi:hypothetical protein
MFYYILSQNVYKYNNTQTYGIDKNFIEIDKKFYLLKYDSYIITIIVLCVVCMACVLTCPCVCKVVQNSQRQWWITTRPRLQPSKTPRPGRSTRNSQYVFSRVTMYLIVTLYNNYIYLFTKSNYVQYTLHLIVKPG